MKQTLQVTWENGTIEDFDVYCGQSKYARRLPKKVGQALVNKKARAVLLYDGKPRTAIEISGRYYMRIMEDEHA